MTFDLILIVVLLALGVAQTCALIFFSGAVVATLRSHAAQLKEHDEIYNLFAVRKAVSPERHEAMDLVVFLKSKSAAAHWIVGLVISTAVAVTTIPQFKEFVLMSFRRWPDFGTWLVSAFGIIFVLRSFNTKAATVAKAQVIMASPDRPTPEAIAEVKPVVTTEGKQ